MPGITQPDSIDLVAQDADGTMRLVIAEEEPWGTHDDEESLLAAKMESYGMYATGQLHDDYPEMEGQLVVVQIDCPTPPDGPIADLLESAVENFGEFGIGVEVNVEPAIDE